MGRRHTFQVLVPSTERLDRFLADQLALSRTQAGRLVGAGAVVVNGERGRASRQLVRGDTLDVEIPEEQRSRELRAHPLTLDVCYEDATLLVLVKPAGLVVHPAPGHWDDTLVNALVARGTVLGADASGRPGIVHRLDKDTSGLMILAKTDAAHRALGRAIQQRHVERDYAALVWGHVRDAMMIDAPIARHPGDRKRMAVLATGRAARTLVEPVARFDTCDLLRLRLATGRTHQIRVHLAHIGHPIVGDPVYGGGGYKRMTGSQRARAHAVERATPRQALHAARLVFRHPTTGADCDVRSDWPPDLRPALAVASEMSALLDRRNVLDYFGFFTQHGPNDPASHPTPDGDS